MEVSLLDLNNIQLLNDFCAKCSDLNWVNNSSIEKMNIDMVKAKQGAFFGVIEADQLVSVSGCYRFNEVSPNAWRIFYRSATLPGKAKNSGLHRGTGLRGRLYISKFAEFTRSTDLYLTTNPHNTEQPSISRYHRSLSIESEMRDSYVHNFGTINLYGIDQTLWKLDLNDYYQRVNK